MNAPAATCAGQYDLFYEDGSTFKGVPIELITVVEASKVEVKVKVASSSARVSKYELQRLENIRRNEDMLRQLDIQQAAAMMAAVGTNDDEDYNGGEQGGPTDGSSDVGDVQEEAKAEEDRLAAEKEAAAKAEEARIAAVEAAAAAQAERVAAEDAEKLAAEAAAKEEAERLAADEKAAVAKAAAEEEIAGEIALTRKSTRNKRPPGEHWKFVTPAPAAISRSAPLAVLWCAANTPVGDVGTMANHAATLSNDSRKKYKLA